MFYCAITKKLSKSGDKPFRLVTERRSVEYKDKDGVVIGHGTEIVKEINVSLAGLGEWCNSHPDDTELRASYQKLIRAEELRRLARLREGNREEIREKPAPMGVQLHEVTGGLPA